MRTYSPDRELAKAHALWPSEQDWAVCTESANWTSDHCHCYWEQKERERKSRQETERDEQRERERTREKKRDVWEERDTRRGGETLPCVRSKRSRGYRHHAHMLKHMCAWCRHTRGRLECTQGDFFWIHTRVFPHFSACRNTHKHTTSHEDRQRDRQREIQRKKTEKERQRKRDKIRQDKRRRDETRQEKMKEEREDKAREEKREERRWKTSEEKIERREERRWKGKWKRKWREIEMKEEMIFVSKNAWEPQTRQMN